jgi:hypothetical protein
MNKPILICLTAAAISVAGCASHKEPPPEAKLVPGPAGERKTYDYSQQVWNEQAVMYSQPQAQAIVDQFKSNYTQMGNPRILIYVNRELVDEQTGLKLSARSEKVDTTTIAGADSSTNSTTTHTSANNNYRNTDKTAPTLADRQTVRDVERLMGRPMRAAGATLVDQRVAAELIADRPFSATGPANDQASRDREAVGKVADVAIEVLIASKNVNSQEISGTKTYTVPDLQATAIRLKDSKIIGQASAAEVMNKAGGPEAVARNFGVQDITEATALALMQDIMAEAK